MQPSGLIVVNKPVGITSRRALDRVTRLVKPAKAGHAGTLDPIAAGVLVICIGSATRLIQYVQQMGKRYRATFRLGCASPSDDIETDVTERINPPQPTASEIEAALPDFLGLIAQRPPAYSAIKINGQRAYDLARAGKAPEMEHRQVRIDSLHVLHYDYPRLTLDIACGSGTYVRSLGRDLAEQLGTAAVMESLTRTAIGDFQLDSALSLDELTIDTLAESLLPPSVAVAKLPSLIVDPQQQGELLHGRTIDVASDSVASDSVASDCRAFDSDIAEIAALNSEGELVAVLVCREAGRWRPSCNFAHTLAEFANQSE